MGMRVGIQEDDQLDDATRAFDDLRAEVAVLRRAVEALGPALKETRSPDYSLSLGQIAKTQAAIGTRLEAIEGDEDASDPIEVLHGGVHAKLALGVAGLLVALGCARVVLGGLEGSPGLRDVSALEVELGGLVELLRPQVDRRDLEGPFEVDEDFGGAIDVAALGKEDGGFLGVSLEQLDLCAAGVGFLGLSLFLEVP